MKPLKSFFQVTLPILVALSLIVASCSTQQPTMKPSAPAVHMFINLDTVKAGPFDTGKMWTFDFPPMKYFAETYNFTPTEDWFERARLTSLRLPNCSASFISEDGLVMTNHHCARGALDRVTREGENLADDGFYAPTLEDERRVPALYIDQLVMIEDVTEEIVKAFESGTTDDERIKLRQDKISEVQQRYRDKTGLVCSVITFYNGGRYSLYGYKRYNDVRLVFAVETNIGYFGGDPDNFTYPRYDVDLSLFRVYENDQPLKTKHYFKFSEAGPVEGEAVFVLGNPGRTSRLLTVSQLEFMRDQSYPFTFDLLDNLVNIYSKHIAKHPDQRMQYQTTLFGVSNSQKLYQGRLKGLRDPVLMAKKRDFERKFQQSIAGKPAVSAQYAGLWNEIEALQAEKAAYFKEFNIYNYGATGRSMFFNLASSMVDYANQMKLPEDQRQPRYKGTMLDTTKMRIYPANLDVELQREILMLHLRLIQQSGSSAVAVLGGQSPAAAADNMLANTILADKNKTMTLLNGEPESILNSTDPFISFVVKMQDRARVVREKNAELQSKEAARVQMLGKAMYDVYGTSIPPDATFTLRIADGVVKSYPYNGTIAPPVTTFYGMYDRYYSYGKREPWLLPERWQNPPASFDMSTPMNFVSTSDIIGGNSGSPVVNKNLEVVGLIFDGNIESLPNDIIYSEDPDRAVAVHSSGILEALDDIYNAKRIVGEIKAGRMMMTQK